MTDERYEALSKEFDLKLTDEEIKEGWHFCCDCDYMLIGPGMEEMECCHCKE